MSRLLHAAARGARIEYSTYCHSSADGYEWVEGANLTRMRKLPEVYRIHPEDTHLAYGPISTALKVMALQRAYVNLREFPRFSIEAAMACKLDGNWTWRWQKQTPFERSLALLILAEALADSGL